MGMQTDSALKASGVKPDVTGVLSCGGITVGTKTAWNGWEGVAGMYASFVAKSFTIVGQLSETGSDHHWLTGFFFGLITVVLKNERTGPDIYNHVVKLLELKPKPELSFLAQAHAHLSPHFANKTSEKGKSGTSFFEHMLTVSAAANLGGGKYWVFVLRKGKY